MKTLLLFLLLPFFSLGQSYKYTRLVITKKGCDNFTFDKEIVRNVEGRILIDSNCVFIDNKQFLLKSGGYTFKARHYIIMFVYIDTNFTGVRLRKQNTDYTYYVVR